MAKAAPKFVQISPGGAVSVGFSERVSPLPMPETCSAAVDQAVLDDLISGLKAIPNSRYRLGVH
jgi:hypothetical protein